MIPPRPEGIKFIAYLEAYTQMYVLQKSASWDTICGDY